MSASQKPLSEQPLGYFLAFMGGTFGLPLGWVLSPLVLYGLNKLTPSSKGKSPNRFAYWALIGIVGAPLCWLPWAIVAAIVTEQQIASCNGGDKQSCRQLLEQETTHSRITSPYFDELKKEAEAARRRNAEIARERAQQAKDAEQKQKFLAWAKSPSPFIGCKMELKNQLRDPGSYEDDFASPSPIINESKKTVSYVWQFRSKNGFGGYAPAAATCETSPEPDDSSFRGFGNATVAIVQQ